MWKWRKIRKLLIFSLSRSYLFVEYLNNPTNLSTNPTVNSKGVLYFGIFFKKLYLLYIYEEYNLLEVYYHASGQRINRNKSSIFFLQKGVLKLSVMWWRIFCMWITNLWMTVTLSVFTYKVTKIFEVELWLIIWPTKYELYFFEKGRLNMSYMSQKCTIGFIFQRCSKQYVFFVSYNLYVIAQILS
jgi:hypothetical protein